ncbi:hypothetical protein L484_006666 [Morus notabilis]|uniref:PWWP domain-containing protein n=1 Tax=Morus notabilis TaxID=981085 RepID=W9SEG4_9ROSA|nr:uncharacterized protein LOC21390089 [Morus notabilis]EXC02372.1 hypothetical protein L484_006666 [Morus notabilis]
MNSDCELDRKSDAIDEHEDLKGRISEGGGGVDGSNDERCSNSRVSEDARVSEMELDPGAQDAAAGPRVPERGGLEKEEVRVKLEVSKESDGGEAYKEMELKESEVKEENSSANGGEEAQNEEESEEYDQKEAQKRSGSQYNSLLSEFDDFVANEESGQIATCRALRYGFEVGDMVWGKVKSHPWWPGHIFNDAFASPQVRRTRREGHVLVAFFGDSSYGWFDPAELVPFEANFAEKSRQTTSRNFMKAVEEAVDEVSRRASLGLSCKCRNPYNFRGTNVQGYFVVDVPDYEPRAVYSAAQIQKARDSFKPAEAVSFIKQLALSPCLGDEKDVSFDKNKATVSAYRKTVFEEYDETYAQAFGEQPGRPRRAPVNSPDQPVKPVKQPPLAPLSGPLVIAETLGGGTSASKHTKAKENSKKDRYLFKRRDESSNLKAHQISQGQASSSAPSACVDGSVAAGDEDYVLQKRAPAVPVKAQISGKHEQTGLISISGADSGSHGRGPISADLTSGSSSLATQHVTEDTKPSLDEGKGPLEEVKQGSGSASDRGVVGSNDLLGNGTLPCVRDGASQSPKQDGEGLAGFKPDEKAKISRSDEQFQQPQLNSTVRVEESHGMDEVRDGHVVGGPSPTDAKRLSGKSTAGGVKKSKAKRPLEELTPENSVEGKKKKKKKQLGSETSFRDPQKNLVSKKVGPSGEKLVGRSTLVGLAPKEELKVEKPKKNVASSINFSDSVGTSVDIGNVELELPQLLSDLQALALDPFHDAERNSPAIVQKFFLRFRSLVYQKSLVLSPPSEAESIEARPTKNSSEHVRDLPSSKSAKPSFRADDPTIAGRKRAPSDRQEEIAAKKSKKMSDIRSLAAEKKAAQKTSEEPRGEAREAAVPSGRKIKHVSIKKAEHTARAVEPTMLVMKFPPKTSLPSPAELKARFARFGPMDQSGLRVFWKSSTCRVVFLHKSDAQAACRFAAANNSLFGTPGMRCYTREVEAPATEAPESGKGQGDDISLDTPRTKDTAVLQRPSSITTKQPLPQAAVQLKSCLKKAATDESGQQGTGVGGGSGNSRGTPRVKFMLDGEDSSSRVEQSLMAGNRNNSSNNSASFPDGGAPSSSNSSSTSTSVAMDFSVRNFQKVISQSPPILPTPQLAKTPLNNLHHLEMIAPPRNTTSIAPPTVDISQQMLSLLTRCNDVVTNVTSLLGYVPYHPL